MCFMNTKALSAICAAHIGARSNHEDNFLIGGRYLTSEEQTQMSDNRCCFVCENAVPKIRLYAISDGMGGHHAGEVASRICVQMLAQLEGTIQHCTSVQEAVGYAQAYIAEINKTVCYLGGKYEHLSGMGATLVLLILDDTSCAVLHIGDSRAYYFNGQTLCQLTKDHTEGQRMLDLGLLTRKELAEFPAKKNLNRYIGYGEAGYCLQADVCYPALQNGTILLCSDGVSDRLSGQQIVEILQSASNLKQAGQRLIEAAVAVPNADNATAILIPLGR